MNTPFQQVKEKFTSKDKLVDEILGIIKRPADTTKDQLKKKLRAQSNKKLMILLDREKTLKEKFGSRDKLIDALCKSNKGKKADSNYGNRLAQRTTGQLLDLANRHNLIK
jgi:hypothetical protein